MPIHRYSAVEVFGVPIEDPERLAREALPGIRRLLESYNVEPQLVQPTDPVDISPPYWQAPKTKFRYFLESQTAGAATIRMMPVYSDSMAASVSNIGGFQVLRPEAQRSYRLPEDQEAFIIAGPGSPRFIGKICIHEAFVNL